MGLSSAQPHKADNGFFWDGSKNLKFYEEEFETMFCNRAREEYDNKAK